MNRMNRAPCSRLLAAFLALSLPLSLAPSPALALRAVGLEESESTRRDVASQLLEGHPEPGNRATLSASSTIAGGVAPRAAGLEELTEGERFWGIQRIRPERLEELLKARRAFLKTRDQVVRRRDRELSREKMRVAFGDAYERYHEAFKDLMARQWQELRLRLGITLGHFGATSSGVSLVFESEEEEQAARRWTPEQVAQEIQQRLEAHPEMFGKLAGVTGVHYWSQVTQENRRLAKRSQAFRALELEHYQAEGGHLDATSQSYPTRAAAEFLEKPPSERAERFFRRVLLTSVMDMDGPEEAAIRQLLEAFGITVPAASEMTPLRYLELLRPLILHSDALPPSVGHKFFLIVAAYAAGGMPAWSWEEWGRVSQEEFLRALLAMVLARYRNHAPLDLDRAFARAVGALTPETVPGLATIMAIQTELSRSPLIER